VLDDREPAAGLPGGEQEADPDRGEVDRDAALGADDLGSGDLQRLR
jgi:hypothetical protein